MRTGADLDLDVLKSLGEGPKDRRTLATLLGESNNRVLQSLRRLKTKVHASYHGQTQQWRPTADGMKRILSSAEVQA
jgi:hypothetical protein